MKINQLCILALLVGCMLSNLSCKKYLESKSNAKLITPSSLTDLQGILDDAAQMNFSRSPSYGETSSDDYFIPEVAINSYSELSRDLYSWRKIDYRFRNDWSEAYLPVYNANLCLETLETIERTAANSKGWDNVKGEALFFRSFYFFHLTAQFGKAYDKAQSIQDLGIVLRLRTDFNQQSVRSSVSECLERVIADASDAIKLLPDFQVNTLRPSRAAGYALLSRVYLYMREYDSALRNANECLKVQNVLMDFNSDPEILGLDINVPFKRFNKETIFYCEMYSGFALHSPGTGLVDTALYSSYAANDLRKRAYFRANGSYQQFKGNYTSNANTLFGGLATDEIYLIRAECRARAGDVVGALQDLNLLLKSRWRNIIAFPPVTAATGEEAIAKIKLERRKELLMRGIRWQDIKRMNKEGDNIVPTRFYKGTFYRLSVNSPFYALPLPADIIEQSGIPQNE
jgi:tetratricopeptide (TPR) repeat protein